MENQPILSSERLILRPFSLSDASTVQYLAGERAIAANTMTIPHPYEDGLAEEWISHHQDEYKADGSVTFAITQHETGSLVGAINLSVKPEFEHGEIGYWIGTPYWNRGYATEAARRILHYGFIVRGLNLIWARHFSNNPASGCVMKKIGMQYEGCLRQHIKKWGVFQDMMYYGILRTEYLISSQGTTC
jgi:ribosomal-protein-alanine N-acetyltransferase